MTTVSSPSTSPGVAAAALRHVTSINDLTNDEIERIFVAADAWLATLGDPLVRHRIARSTDSAHGRILATLFHEPSTRTRLSFESAMIRLGGQIVTSADPATSSAAKGESLADTVRVVSNYADAIVLRHPRDGAARLAAEYASVPIINGGDGAHEHPTQTLCDLFTLRRENKRLRNLNVVVSGDLRGSRTIHSFVYALARFGANIMLMPAKGMELPAHVDERLREEFNCRPVPRQMYEEDNAAINALYVTPDMPHQLSLIPSVEMDAPVDHKIRKKIDVMYVTRFQKERWAEASGDYPRIDSNFLRESKYSDTAVLHPLPRVGELDVALDGDSRALYFHQASYGVPIRMALIGMLLETEGRPGLERYSGGFPPAPRALYDRPSAAGLRCVNPNCIVHDPLERDYTRSKFWLMDGGPEGAQRLRCVYCETNAEARAVGNAKKREFALIADAPLPDRHHPLPEHLVFFRDAEDARAHGYAERAGHGKRGAGAA